MLWRKILNVDDVGCNDNFFLLGGSSIDAVNLFVEVEQRFKRRLPLSILLEAPTLKQFAAFIQENEQRLPTGRHLSQFGRAGACTPFFWFMVLKETFYCTEN